MRLRDYVLALSSGLGINAVAVAVKKMSDDSLVESVSTAGSDEAGQWVHTSDGSPGRVYAVATYAGNTRRLYGGRSHQLPGGWTDEEMLDLYGQWEPGVLRDVSGELEVTAPGGMFVAVASGACVAKGQFYRKWSAGGNDLAVPANSTGSARQDMVIVRFTRTGADKWASEIHYSSNDVIPTESSDTWEVVLARVTVPDGASAITSGMIDDYRAFAYIDPGEIYRADQTAQTSADNATNTTTSYVNAATLALVLPKGSWHVRAIAGVNLKHSASGQGELRLKLGSTSGTSRELSLTTTYEQCVDNAEATIDTDGSENITLEYRRIDAGTVSARNPWIWVNAIRAG